ncbi:MAG: GntR family transcriptional regulator [Candidatus Moduliflexus flocculans]|nr:GntR family transcriptional regulator [Candidatus Moduliflexus flocculans]
MDLETRLFSGPRDPQRDHLPIPQESPPRRRHQAGPAPPGEGDRGPVQHLVDPVREAFFRLAAEKFLVINARKEVLAQDTTLEEVRELYEIVRTLDLLAARRALARMTPGDIEDLRDMTGELGRFHDADDHSNYLEQNLCIHDRIWRHAGSAALYDTLSEVMAKIRIFHRKNGFLPFAARPALEKSFGDHLELLRLVEARDIKRLEKLIEAHWGEEFSVGRATGPGSGKATGR